MAVFLSPVGGAGAQFFDANGTPLSGGKLYTYSAGTTTPAATYTSSAGNVSHSNPIILDAAGRVPGSSEIWLTDSVAYKFVLKDSNDVLQATWDNITGINSNFVNFTAQEEVQTATAGQTVFTLADITYAPGSNNLQVFVDGVNQIVDDSYIETNSTTVTFVSGLHVGALVKFTTAVSNSSGIETDASLVTYDPPFTGSESTTVEAKLAQYVSIIDFGGSPSNTASANNVAIQAALSYLETVDGGTLYFPSGVYQISDEIAVPRGVNIKGASYFSTWLVQNDNAKAIINVTNPQPANTFSDSLISDIRLQGGAYGGVCGVAGTIENGIFFRFERVHFYGNNENFRFNSGWMAHFKQCKFEAPVDGCVLFTELSGGAFYNSINFEGCWFYPAGATDCVKLPTGNNAGILFSNRCIFESYATDPGGLTLHAIAMNNFSAEIHGVTIRDCYFEGFSAQRIKLSPNTSNTNILIADNYFATPGSTNSPIIAEIAGATITNNYGTLDSGTTASPIAAATNCVFGGNLWTTTGYNRFPDVRNPVNSINCTGNGAGMPGALLIGSSGDTDIRTTFIWETFQPPSFSSFNNGRFDWIQFMYRNGASGQYGIATLPVLVSIRYDSLTSTPVVAKGPSGTTIANPSTGVYRVTFPADFWSDFDRNNFNVSAQFVANDPTNANLKIAVPTKNVPVSGDLEFRVYNAGGSLVNIGNFDEFVDLTIRMASAGT